MAFRMLRSQKTFVLAFVTYIACLFTYCVYQLDVILAEVENESRKNHRELSEFNGLLLPRKLKPSEYSIPAWQRNEKSWGFENNYNRTYFLTGILHVRLSYSPVGLWTLAELKQWLHYMFWSGVEHVYICNRHAEASEIFSPDLQNYINMGLVTVVPWKYNAVSLRDQQRCYSHIIRHYGNQSSWQLALGIDEYPYSPADVSEGFLSNYIQRKTRETQFNAVSEIQLKKHRMFGKGDVSRNMTIDRINQIEYSPPINNTQTVIFMPRKCMADSSTSIETDGEASQVPENELRLLQYWGTRKVDRSKISSKDTVPYTVAFNDVRDTLAKTVRKSLISFGEYKAFSSKSGP